MSSAPPLIVLGAGGHAKVLIESIMIGRAKILGIAERVGSLDTVDVLGVPIIGDDDSILRFSPDDVQLVNGVGAVATNRWRHSLFERFVSLGYRFASVVHPSAVISSSVGLAEGVQVMAGAVIQAGTVIGANSIVNTNATVDHDCQIAKHVHVASGATLCGGIHVGTDTLIGAGAVLIQGVRIGCHALVAAGAVVINDVADGTRVAGIPARIMEKKDQ